MKLTLRGHHLLCLKGFQGYGYDEAFVENMSDINLKRKLKTTTITLTDKKDDICSACPNLKDNLCKNKMNNEKIVKMDKAVLKHFETSKCYNSIELFDKIDEIYNSKESVSKICFECMWHEKCIFYQKIDSFK